MASPSKVRLVVGLIGTSGELASALADLDALGLKPSQIHVIGQADAFDGAFAGWRESGGARAGWIVCRPVGASASWAFAAADEAAPSTALDDARALLGFHQWSLRRQARQLHLYLEQGGALLLVEPDTEAVERATCTVLLQHASGGVQTHEIARSQNR
jgi:hypothetical protein